MILYSAGLLVQSRSLSHLPEVAIGIREEQKATYNEGGSFTLTKFDGTTVTI